MGWVNVRWTNIYVGSVQVQAIGMMDSESFQSLPLNKDEEKNKTKPTLAQLLNPLTLAGELSQLAKGI